MHPKAFKNRSKNEARKYYEQLSKNNSKIDPRIPNRFPNTASIFYRFGSCFAFPWAPFGLPFSSLWLPLGSLLAPFGTLWLPLGSLGAVCGPPKDLIASGGEISPRSCRNSAENVPRTLQESAENPPYEPQAKSPFALQLLRKDFVLRQTLRQNRLE